MTKNAAPWQDAAFSLCLARDAARFTHAVWVWLGIELVLEPWLRRGGVNMVLSVAFSLVIEKTIQKTRRRVNFKY